MQRADYATTSWNMRSAVGKCSSPAPRTSFASVRYKIADGAGGTRVHARPQAAGMTRDDHAKAVVLVKFASACS